MLMYIRWSFLHRLNIGFNPYNGGFMWNRANVYSGSTFVLLWSTCIVLHKSMYVRIVNTNLIVYIRYTGSSDGQDEWSSVKVEFSVIRLQWWQGVVMCGYFKMLPISCVVYSNIWSLENRNFKEILLTLSKDVYPHTHAHSFFWYKLCIYKLHQIIHNSSTRLNIYLVNIYRNEKLINR